MSELLTTTDSAYLKEVREVSALIGNLDKSMIVMGKDYPVTIEREGDLYARTTLVPSGHVLISKYHKQPSYFVVRKGSLVIYLGNRKTLKVKTGFATFSLPDSIKLMLSSEDTLITAIWSVPSSMPTEEVEDYLTEDI